MTIKTDFIPSEDQGQINVNTESADRTSFAQMKKYQAQLADIAARDPNVQAVMSTVGGGGGAVGHQHRRHAVQTQAAWPAQPVGR